MDTSTTPNPSPAALPVLRQLLDDELACSPTVQRVYSNHLAMALAALARLGAGPAALRAAYRVQFGECEPRDDVAALDARLHEVRRDGIAAAVAAQVPHLVDAPASALFHPLIRLSYALEIGHEGQVAAALLDWAERRAPLPLAAPTRGRHRLPEVAAALAAHPSGTWSRSFDLPGIARRSELRSAVDTLRVDRHTLDDLSAFVIAAHLAADDFITLHLVTGVRAVRVVAGWLDSDVAARLVAATACAVTVGYAAVGAPPLPDAAALNALRRLPLPSRERVARRAITSEDPHVIKLADVALAEELRSGDALYRLAAARVVGLVGEPALSG